MRYAYNGRFRSNKQPTYGHIEARNSSEAIDALADLGIIGVMTVRPDPLPAAPPDSVREPKNVATPKPMLPAELAVELRQNIAQVSEMLRQTEGLLQRPHLRIVEDTDWHSPEDRVEKPHPSKHRAS